MKQAGTSIAQGPRWRWSCAEELTLADRRGEASEGPQDFYVYLAHRLCKFMDNQFGRVWVRAKWPMLYDMYLLGTEPHRFKTSRVSLEVCLLGGLTPEETADKLLWLTPLHALIYSKWFFDVDGFRKEPYWIEDYVLAPYKKEDRLTNWVVALILASQGHIDDALSYILTGKAPDPEIHKTLRKNERNKYLTNYIMKGVKLPAELAAPMVESAVRAEEDIERQTEKELSKSGISLTESEITLLQEATEKYADSQAGKYSTGPDGVEELPGMSEVRERWKQQEDKVDKDV